MKIRNKFGGKMNKQKLRKIGYIALVIAFILLSINRYMDYKWEKESSEFNAKYEAILQDAIDTEDVSLCKNHNFKLKCVSQVGIQTDNPGVCEEFYQKDLQIVTCKAIVFDDISYCDRQLKGLDKTTCKEAIELMRKDISLI